MAPWGQVVIFKTSPSAGDWAPPELSSQLCTTLLAAHPKAVDDLADDEFLASDRARQAMSRNIGTVNAYDWLAFGNVKNKDGRRLRLGYFRLCASQTFDRTAPAPHASSRSDSSLSRVECSQNRRGSRRGR